MPELFHVKPPGEILQVGESRLHVLAEGDGPVVVLCGGLAGNWFDWDDCARHLQSDHTVVRFDRPGFGLSEPTSEVPTVRGEAQRICDVLDTLGLSGPAVVVGHSIAGFYVEGFARLFPDRAAGMLLLDSSAEKEPKRLFPRDLLLIASRAAAASFSTTGLQRLLGTTTRKILNQSVPPSGSSEATLEWVRKIYREPHYLEAAMIEYVAYTDMALELTALRRSSKHPLPDIDLSVVAAHTGHTTPWSIAWMAKQQKLATYLGGSFHVLRPAHHHAMIDQPEELANLIRRLTQPNRRGMTLKVTTRTVAGSLLVSDSFCFLRQADHGPFDTSGALVPDFRGDPRCRPGGHRRPSARFSVDLLARQRNPSGHSPP